MKKIASIAVFALGLTLSATAGACTFHRAHYGPENKEAYEAISEEVTEQWCSKFPSKEYTLVVISDRAGTIGVRSQSYALAGVVKRNGRDDIPVRRFGVFSVSKDGTIGGAMENQTDAIRAAVRDLMSALDSIDKSEIK